MSSINSILLLILAVLLVGSRLPGYLNRQGLKTSQKIVSVLFTFAVVMLVWLFLLTVSTFVGFF